jgi:hypothetical protein
MIVSKPRCYGGVIHGYKLIGVVPWGSDHTFGSFDSKKEAEEKAKEMGCKIGNY